MKKEIIIIIAALLVMLSIVLLLILPGIDNLTSASAELAGQKQLLLEIQKNIDRMEQLKAQGNEIESCYQAAIQILPVEKENDHPNLSALFEKIAKDNNLKAEDIRFSEIKQAETSSSASAEPTEIFGGKSTSVAPASQPTSASVQYKTVSVGLRLSGTYEDFKKYLSDLENLVEKKSRIIDVISLSYSSQAKQEGAQMIYSFQITVYVYYQ